MSVTAPISGPQVTAAGVPPAASSSLVAKYRGATVEDLQVSPAISVPRSMAIGAALRVALDHDYSQLPLVSDADRKLLGYVDVARLREAEATPDAPVGSIMSRFAKASPQTQYTVITPDTGLAELELFLQSHPFAFITDPNRAFVLGVATKEDLDKYADRRALHGTRDGAATPTNAGPRPSAAPAEQMSRREEEEARKDRTLAEFLRLLDNYTPLIPDQVTDFYLEKVGFECHDLRLKRLLSLAAEKFVSDIAADAFQYARIRTNAGPGGRPRGPAGARDRSRTVLTMDDLSAALGEYGINARRAEYYR